MDQQRSRDRARPEQRFSQQSYRGLDPKPFKPREFTDELQQLRHFGGGDGTDLEIHVASYQRQELFDKLCFFGARCQLE